MEATSMGYLDQERKNLRSTKITNEDHSMNMINEDHLPLRLTKKQTKFIILSITWTMIKII